jgi:hypothetical protein
MRPQQLRAIKVLAPSPIFHIAKMGVIVELTKPAR